ncbi:hypothetical protein [Novosphingobium sp. 9]|uniref:hypothetical protein n=1 Tax=Novosphingobium sp. 9 TaxID=2025349 RepID=UPI0021B4F4EC|nr:hypothetical protein [Novosphingobium sp. 9]
MSRLGYIVVTLVCAELFAGLYLAVLLVQPRPMLVWNATASAPIGLYRLSDGQYSAVILSFFARPKGWQD